MATHTYTHPYQWSFFENYDRELEERLIGPDETEWKAVLGDRMRRIARRLFPGLVRKGAETEGKFVDDDPPRAYSDFPFDLDQEIRGAITAAEEMAPEGKHGTLYLWSGGAEPFEGAIARTRRLGLRNLNGGDSRFDADYPSISYLAPISRAAGAERQIYAGNANDYIYITDGGGRDHGFLHLDATINATESPRRLKPINIYYHMFAGERAAQLAGVRHHLDAARQAAVTPIAASHYAAIADGFFSTQMTALGESSWLIQNRGALQTVRFDDVAALAVDFTRSVGVIGQRRKENSLYVALDEAYDEVIVALGPDAGESADTSAPHLIEGRWTFRDMRRRECGFTVMAKGYGTGQMTWGGLKPGTYHVFVREFQRDRVGRRHRGGRRRQARAHRRRRCHEPARDRSRLRRLQRAALMFRHIALIILLTLVALAAGVAMVPGEREQWTMLVRDGRNQEAHQGARGPLSRRQARGRCGPASLQALYVVCRDRHATRIMQEFVADHPDDPAVVSLLAKHYGDIQDRPAEIRTLGAAVRAVALACRPRAICWPIIGCKGRSTARRACCARCSPTR